MNTVVMAMFGRWLCNERWRLTSVTWPLLWNKGSRCWFYVIWMYDTELLSWIFELTMFQGIICLARYSCSWRGGWQSFTTSRKTSRKFAEEYNVYYDGLRCFGVALRNNFGVFRVTFVTQVNPDYSTWAKIGHWLMAIHGMSIHYCV